jgi:hypothetical protein
VSEGERDGGYENDERDEKKYDNEPFTRRCCVRFTTTGISEYSHPKLKPMSSDINSCFLGY